MVPVQSLIQGIRVLNPKGKCQPVFKTINLAVAMQEPILAVDVVD